jgi:PilZ domain
MPLGLWRLRVLISARPEAVGRRRALGGAHGPEAWQRELKLMRKQHPSPKSSRRRSSRILLRLPLLVGKSDSSSLTRWESVETVMLSRHGGLLRAQQNFGVGTSIEIRMQNKDRTAHARVVWKSSRPTPQGMELGFEIIDHPAFWEIRFPPES